MLASLMPGRLDSLTSSPSLSAHCLAASSLAWIVRAISSARTEPARRWASASSCSRSSSCAGPSMASSACPSHACSACCSASSGTSGMSNLFDLASFTSPVSSCHVEDESAIAVFARTIQARTSPSRLSRSSWCSSSIFRFSARVARSFKTASTSGVTATGGSSTAAASTAHVRASASRSRACSISTASSCKLSASASRVSTSAHVSRGPSALRDDLRRNSSLWIRVVHFR